jgi:nitroreductase
MIARDIIEHILDFAALAPSGDNAQPWHFVVRGDAVDCYNIPGRDYSPYNFLERGSFFAHGAVIENIMIAASSFGIAVTVSLFPDSKDDTHVARLALADTKLATDPLFPYLASRVTNRKPYKKERLSSENKEALLADFKKDGSMQMRLVETKKEIGTFAKTVSLSDRLIFEDRKIHDAIFGALRWTPEEEKERPGLYIKTLELPPPARLLFKKLKHWRLLSMLNRIKISRVIALGSANVYAASAAIGMLTIPDDAPQTFVRAGMAFERFWLTATGRGISLQPVTALAYLAERIHAGEGGLSPLHAGQIMAAQKKINELFLNPPGVIAMMFRMGYASAPSARSQKHKPQVTYAS